MKRFMTMAMAAAMVASMGTTAMAADAKTAVASSAKVAVNGVEIAPEAYTIDGYTFFKLRDVAAAVAGTEAGFDVTWDAEAKKIALTTGVSYEAVAEAGKKAEGEKAAVLSTAPVLVDGEEAVLTAYTIDGYTYFKLRDLGTAAGFEVTWDDAAKMIGINAAVLEEEVTDEDVDLTEEEMQDKLEEVYKEMEELLEADPELKEEVEQRFPACDAIEYDDLAADEVYEWDGETFEGDVHLHCAPLEDEASYYELIFTNCVFEGDVYLIADGQAEIMIGEGCEFAEGCGMIVQEYTEGYAETQGNEFLSGVMIEAEGVEVTAYSGVTVHNGMSGFDYTLNGEVFSADDFGVDADAIMNHQAKYYYEDGEAYVLHEATVVNEDGSVETVYAE